jgi:competence protein ComGB
MQNGFTLQDSLQLLESSRNHEAFEKIRSQLSAGSSASEALLGFCPPVYRRYLEGFLQILPLQESLTLSIRTVQQEESQRKEYRKGLLYPCALFLATVVGLILFNELCFPPLLSMMRGFRVSLDSFAGFHAAARVISSVLIIMLACAGVCTAWFLQEPHQIRGYQILKRILPQSMIIQYASMDLIRFFLECTKMGIHTKQSIAVMKGISHRPIICFLAGEIEQSLIAGDSFEHAVDSPYLDTALTRFMKIAVYSANLETMMEGYLTMSLERVHRQCAVLTRVIQICCYAGIGAILIMVYQILLMPLSIMSQM